jgi:hypothetical protein
MLLMPEMEAAASGREYNTAQNRTAQGNTGHGGQRQRNGNQEAPKEANRKDWQTSEHSSWRSS